jgi:hypothetical protein
VLVAGVAFLTVAGDDQRLQAGLVERLAGLVEDPGFFVLFPLVGAGAHSIPLAVWWALPWSLLALAAAGALGWQLVSPRNAAVPSRGRLRLRHVVMALGLVAAANLPVVLNVTRQGSPRLFTPTWLLLVTLATLAAARTHWPRPRVAGAIIGMAAAGAVLSLTLSASVRLSSAAVVETGARHIASQTSDGDVVALCDVRRTVVEPAPRGAFAVHDFLYDWAAADAIDYYTQRDVDVRVAGSGCPETSDADLVLGFDELVARGLDR